MYLNNQGLVGKQDSCSAIVEQLGFLNTNFKFFSDYFDSKKPEALQRFTKELRFPKIQDCIRTKNFIFKKDCLKNSSCILFKRLYPT